MLAGISVDYYLRLERGRDRHPSRQVLDALAVALQLDADQSAYLHALAAVPGTRGQGGMAGAEVPQSAIEILHSLRLPAFIEDRYFTVLHSNEQAVALNPRLVPGRNQLRDLLLEVEEQAMHPHVDLTAACLVASLRHSMGNEVADAQFVKLTDELHASSERFREVWARYEVQAQRGATLALTHPTAGAVHFVREQLAITAAPHLKLVVCSPSTAPLGVPRVP